MKKKTPARNNRRQTENVVGRPNEGDFFLRSIIKGKMEEKDETENDVIGLDDEAVLQQIEGERHAK